MTRKALGEMKHGEMTLTPWCEVFQEVRDIKNGVAWMSCGRDVNLPLIHALGFHFRFHEISKLFDFFQFLNFLVYLWLRQLNFSVIYARSEEKIQQFFVDG